MKFTNSSTISEAEYFPESKILRITYTTGKKYDYAGVPETLWTAMQSATSVGSFVANNIKGNYQYKLVKE